MEDRSRRRARLILILGIVLAFIAAGGTFIVASSKTEAPPVIPTTDILVATRELPPRTQIATTDVKVVKMNSDVVPPGAIRDAKEVVGKVNTVPIGVGEPILPGKFAAAAGQPWTVFPPNQPIQAGQSIPPGTPNYRVLSITVPDPQAVGGAIQAGDVVDIVYTFNFDPNKFLKGTNPDRITDFSAKIVLQNVPILARAAAVYTIRTDAETAERIAYLTASGGTLQFLLRAAQDQRAVSTTGATFGNTYDQNRLKIPERITAP